MMRNRFRFPAFVSLDLSRMFTARVSGKGFDRPCPASLCL